MIRASLSSSNKRSVQNRRQQALQKILRRLLTVEFLIGIAFILSGDAFDGGALYRQLIRYVGGVTFDYFGWEADALLRKADQEMAGVQAYLDEDQRAAYVRDYLKTVANMQTLDAKIAQVYANPAISDPVNASVDLRQKRDVARADVTHRESLAESIVEGQIGAVLRDEGFATLGQVLPPVAAHITQLPDYLVISPRNAIKFEDALTLNNLSADQASALEDAIDRNVDVSSIVVPLGGLSLYPSMITQTWYAPSLFETISHEWCHHYLYFFPLGLNYDAPETRIINETTATLFGQEIGRKVIERFYTKYPDILAELPATTPATPIKATVTPTPAGDPDARPPFDYGTAMNETRVTVDFYLWLGRVDLAELYMSARRTVFAAHGYYFRKINQAFFAFYGGYQGTGGSSAGGTDPTGPAIGRLRANSPTVHAWLEKMRGITTRAELLSAAGQ